MVESKTTWIDRSPRGFEEYFNTLHPYWDTLASRASSLKAGVHLKAVFQLGIKLLMQISRLRFKQSRISMLISHIYVLGRCGNFLVIFRYICR